MRVTKKLLLGTVVATSALVMAACAPQADGGDAGGDETMGPSEVTVGIVSSESGPLAGYGEQYLCGFATA